MVGHQLPQEDGYRVEPAARRDGRAVVEVLAESFSGYPWTSWIVPAEGHGQRLRALFDLTVTAIALPYGDVWVARGPGAGATIVGGVVVLRPDRQVPPEVWEQAGAAQADVMGDRLAAATQAEAACAGLRPADPHLTVATMAVHPRHRRRGVASALLQPVLALADELRSPTYLETSSEGNVALYRRVGFAVTGRVDIPDGGPSVWAMRREARGTGADEPPG
ncbi:GNAT family N-acetyltransferase [Ornithinicoccus halotolerans]|uniref:GNAT family N-acetyltransferase n=1 Tax=Ornithinicoccus halotolerans TaxID=1748220 RepID=UPI001E5741BA|nr:GNAT family N-acetyltransferase [Ornithinicoccus halotolerans]